MPRIARTLPALLAATLLTGCLTTGVEVSPQVRALWARAGELSPAGERRLQADMSPAMIALAHRVEPGRHADLWGRPPAWAALDIATPPHLDFGVITQDDARRLNSLMPFQLETPTPAQPFYLRALGPQRDRALLCLTQAIYYEAGLEPTEGQEAVAQVILNRMRHPAFPKTICGVVYQGSQQITGCQFSFTCDGSRDRAPEPDVWKRAHAVAEQAVSGFVMPLVGTATHYHADYVFPRWGPTLVKLTQIGAHIFYRLPGPLGRPGAFVGPYSGRELEVSMQGPSAETLAAAKAAAEAGLAPAGPAIDPTAAAEPPHAVPGQMVGGRRLPTREEIARINAALAAYETGHAAPATSAATPAPPVVTPPPPAARPADAKAKASPERSPTATPKGE
ncbi:cell wall hydrolase [Caulobacter sp. KR2-114]|uniref:cell wall hydrolase n=1 Tax=Caulobacter sp. KR2-114 TaxID=3400912 RepID=UPI003BFE1E0A